MDVHATIRDDIQTLRRIAVTLIALAVLAERAGSRSFPVRFLVLCFLRTAEAIAREFIAGVMHTRPAGAAAIENGPEHAVLLALRFRALAAALATLLRKSCRSACPDARVARVARCLEPRPGRLPITTGGWKPRPNDTS